MHQQTRKEDTNKENNNNNNHKRGMGVAPSKQYLPFSISFGETAAGHDEIPIDELTPDLIRLNKQILDLKFDLYKMRVHGIIQRDKYNAELDDLDSDLFYKKMELMKLAGDCYKEFSFGDYMRIIQSVYQSSDRPTYPSKSIFRNDGEKETAIVPQYYTVTYTFFAFFEAYLLRRLHIAMLQQKQQKIHSKTWSQAIADMYFEIPAVVKKFKETMTNLDFLQETVQQKKSKMEDLFANHVR